MIQAEFIKERSVLLFCETSKASKFPALCDVTGADLDSCFKLELHTKRGSCYWTHLYTVTLIGGLPADMRPFIVRVTAFQTSAVAVTQCFEF